MITRAQIRRQLRAQGGITNVVSREKYGLGSKIKERFRKLIPNELASVAVAAAPFVAPFNPGIAAAMRGIGRFDQRGSISDALKQGIGTFAFGKAAGYLGGAKSDPGLFGRQKFTRAGFDEGPIGRIFQKPLTQGDPNFVGGDASKGKLLGTDPTPATTEKGMRFMKDATGLFKDVPILKDLPSLVQQQILVGGVSGAATYIHQAFLAEEPPQQEFESNEEYMARRRKNVGGKMRAYFDNYFKFDKDYSAMTDEQKNAFIDRVNRKDGGRASYQTGGITMANTLAENIRRNLANQAAVAQQFRQARTNIPGYVKPVVQPSPKAAPIRIEEPDLPISKPVQPPGGDVQPILPVMPGQPSRPDDVVERVLPMEPRGPDGDGIGGMLPDFYERVIPPLMPVEEVDRPPETVRGIEPRYNDPLPYDQLMAGFEEWKRNNPDKLGGAGTTAMVPVTLPGGYEYDFTGGAQANQFRQYLESIGQAPYQSRQEGMLLEKLAGGGMPTGVMRTNQAGIMERDYRDKGGFVPVGIKEKADDVPAMLSKNEFVMTADAVRGAGNGSIDKGAQRMYDTMKRLEKRVV